MNKMNITYSFATLRFCRWSRKAYSAFFSLGRHVTIGSLKKAIVECSLMKHDPLQMATSDMHRLSGVCTDNEHEEDANCMVTAIIASCRNIMPVSCRIPSDCSEEKD